jgi:hypothetical protein
MNLNRPYMIIKVLPFFSYARHTQEIPKKLTREQWIHADRIVMMIILIVVILGSVLFA